MTSPTKMETSNVTRWLLSAILLVSLLHVTRGTGTVTFNGNSKAEAEEDLHNLLEDEQFFVADTNYGYKHHKQKPAKVFNSTTSVAITAARDHTEKGVTLPSRQSRDHTEKVVTLPSRQSTLTPLLPKSSFSAGAQQEEDEDGFALDLLEDDLLLFSPELEALEKGEELRRNAENAVARRVRRAAVVYEGSGTTPVEAAITLGLQYNSDWSNPSTAAYSAQKQAVEASLSYSLASVSSFAEAVVTEFIQGSSWSETVIKLTVHFHESVYDNTTDDAELATKFVEIERSGLRIGATNYTATTYTTLTKDLIPRPSRCFLCQGYQKCSQNNAPTEAYYMFFCESSSEFYFPNGVNQGDKIMAKDQDRQTVEMNLPSPIPVGEQQVQTVYVSMHGLMSFGKQYRSFSPRALPVANRTLFCGYWATMQLLSSDLSNNIGYQMYDRNKAVTEQQKKVFSTADMYVQSFAHIDFSATSVIVVTYDQVAPDHSPFAKRERVNFQQILITDSIRTYGMIIYQAGGMLWDQVLNRNVSIGYLNTALGINKARPDGVLGNTDLPGVWFFQLGELPADNPVQDCLNWYYEQLPQRDRLTRANRRMPTCPCNIDIARFRNEWLEETSTSGSLTCFINVPLSDQYGKRCCYNSRNNYETTRPKAGSLLLYHPKTNPAKNYRQDTLPKKRCCQDSKLCALYYDVRPTDTCQEYIIVVIAIVRGDPHITTLDGREFPYNAIGEFCLIESRGEFNFDLQARTCQAVSENGSLAAASVFCGFVARGNGSDIVQVDLSRNRTSMVVYANRQDLTLRFREEGDNFTVVKDDVVLQRINQTLKVAFTGGISINVTLGMELLTFSISVETSLTATFRGLLGNRNGNPDDDFIFPNGTMLPANSSERELFEYGKAWALTNETSVFYYPPGVNVESYTNNSFTPAFADEITDEQRMNASKFCGNDTGCIYDFIITGNQQLAQETKMAADERETAIDMGKNTIPLLSGPSRINATVGKTAEMLFSASDEENQTLSFYPISFPSYGFSYDNYTLSANWTPTDTNSTILQFAAEDSTGAQSPVYSVEVVLCSGCSNHGDCNFDVVRGGQEYFTMATCHCLPYYSGDDCENDFDACADNPCPETTNCTDLPAEQHIAAGPDSLGYNCTECPTGYLLNCTTLKCIDIDECTNSSVCDPNSGCTNTLGSFFCTCDAGYRSLTQDGRGCRDIDECVEQTHHCEQICVNTPGSFNCGCQPGFQPQNKIACTTTEDTCRGENLTCSYACVNKSGSSRCMCPIGFQLAANSRDCQNVNECELGVCSQTCIDTNGSFTCTCLPGYQLSSDKVTCVDCPSDQYGVNCNATCECRGRGTCHKVHGCRCQDGWTGPTCTTDVNECETLPNACPTGQVCTNTNGSYKCACPPGYTMYNEQCTDIDECSLYTSNCTQVCTNMPGCFLCSCLAGYRLIPQNNSCVDIDECETETDRCEQICSNYPGSANCECRYGFHLADNRKGCVKDFDPCESLAASTNQTCQYGCDATSGQAQCFCMRGYQVATDNLQCVDVNECSSNTTNECSQQCLNYPGGYQCACDVGYTLGSDYRKCAVCDPYHWGVDCNNTCNCSPVGASVCDPVTGCVCNPGWLGTLCDKDRDECTTNPCSDNANCVNTPGSYRCVCQPGYTGSGNGSSCVDLDECENNPCDQNCTNTEGSYFCTCRTGFYSEGDACHDVNECLLPGTCSQLCRNTIGSFACECYDGYIFNTTTRRTCNVKTECTLTNCSHGCLVHNTTEECFCFQGYQLADDRTTCIDVDECLSRPCVGGQCANSNGSFECSCTPGHALQPDNVTCLACSKDKYGEDCAQFCTCNVTNTVSCDPVNGTCRCQSGWTDHSCNVDIDECSGGVCNSTANSTCYNTLGSYRCVCNEGFFSSSGRCYPCDATHYGKECAHECTCVRANTLYCDDVTGSCTCLKSWTGANCSEDVDECKVTGTCRTNASEVCRNYPGGFSCDCISGYERPSPADSCTDVNECLYVGLNTCNRTSQDCNNYPGGFNCTCKAGYYQSGQTCKACSCHPNNTYSCDPNNDTCTCKQGWQGANCDVDIDECPSKPCANVSNTYCSNTNGSYSCLCQDGFYSSSGQCSPCTGLEYGPNCAYNCSCSINNTDRCDPVNGTCTCNQGWEGANCDTDVDECLRSPCNNVSHIYCSNTNGSYICLCQDGFFNSSGQCLECPDGLYGKDCFSKCTCNVNNSVSCNPANGSCTCKPEWTGLTCNDDFNECAYSGCMNVSDSWCSNTVGSFKCICTYGVGNSSTQCLPQSQCISKNCSQGCALNNGTEECFCLPGYQLNTDRTNCSDINECLSDPCVNGNCTDLSNSFSCSCGPGTVLQHDNVTCQVCSPFKYGLDCSFNCTCNAASTLSCDPVTGSCTCKDGWDGTNCEKDVDECLRNPCLNGTCTNLNGSFSCSCSAGSSIQPDNTTCEVCSPFKYGVGCSSNCTCNVANTLRCDPVTGSCTCKLGWNGNGTNCDKDIDECLSSPCTNGTCTNVNGSFTCSCRPGSVLQLDNVTCQACSPFKYGLDCIYNCACNMANTVSCDPATGSCTCKQGWNGTNCLEDIDECLINPCINGTCTNLNGSYACSCSTGSALQPDNVTCQDCTSSKYGPNCSSNCTCNVVNTVKCDPVTGSCTCKGGWNGTNCEKDVDECLSSPCVNGSCTNLDGSFACSCLAGASLQPDNVTCQACPSFKYGPNCSSNCTCNVANTLTCDAATGSCTCKQGWNGTNCEEDVDECLSNPCANGSCSNLNGSFACSCTPGSALQSDNLTCQACPSFKYGANCSSNCTCNVANTLTCDAATGSCTCKQGWNGTNCEEDVDECLSNPCTKGSCSNLNGSFACSCTPGSALQSDNLTCQVEAAITLGLQYNSDWSNPSTAAYSAQKQAVEASLSYSLASVSSFAEAVVTEFIPGSSRSETFIKLTVHFHESVYITEELATKFVEIERSGLQIGATNYMATTYTTLTKDINPRPSRCFLCQGYQKCSQNNAPKVAYEMFFCESSSQFYFPNGVNQGDKIMAKDQDRQTVEMNLPSPIPVGEQQVQTVYVSMHGLMSFGKQYRSFSPRALPVANRTLFCGYWATMQLLSSDLSNNIGYQMYDRNKAVTEQQKKVFSTADMYVQLFAHIDFSATSVIVVTYDQVTPDHSAFVKRERVNFQQVLITDSIRTYGMIIYQAGGMLWDQVLNRDVSIGYLNTALSINKARPDGVLGNTDLPGVWFFQLGELPADNPVQDCLNWYYEQLPQRDRLTRANRRMPTCPCNIDIARFRNEWLEETPTSGSLTCFINVPLSDQYGKRCCYNSRNNYETTRPKAGSFLLYHPTTNPAKNYRQDTLPKKRCCQDSKLCALYYDARPTDTCQEYIIVVIAIVRGDPHITTLDGREFPYNAIGEYCLIESRGEFNFDLQARTCQAVSENGTLSAASVFCGFVARGNGSDIVQVDLSRNRTSMVVYANRQDLTLRFREEGDNFTVVKDDVVLQRINQTLKVAFTGGISINVTLGMELLTFSISVETSLNATFKGLLGNRNGNPDDDFIFPNGTMLPANSSERELFEYGKAWALTNETSVFYYPPGVNVESYTNNSFTPAFADEITDEQRMNASKFCGNDTGCIYDFIITGNQQLAQETKMAADERETAIDMGKNTIPLLSGPSRINATVGNTSEMLFSASDEENQTLSFYPISFPSYGFSYDNYTLSANWTPTDTNSTILQFAAEDSTGAQSPVYSVEVVLCSGCSNHGYCNFDVVRGGQEYFTMATCDCLPYYSGDDCEYDFDACTDNPCPATTNCTDLPAEQHIAGGPDSLGYNCTECPTGYLLNYATLHCIDIDECTNSSVCDPNSGCTNTLGSFFCTCDAGYRSLTQDGRGCRDIDECVEQTHHCEQICVNTPGSFNCGCQPGFQLQNKIACTTTEDACRGANLTCSYACLNTSGSPRCMCPIGFQLAANGRDCQNVNECELGVCSQTCIDTNGSFACTCLPGYQLSSDKVTCVDCPSDQYGVNCNATCECRGRGTCHKVHGCRCQDGWTGPTCTTDVNECETLPNACPMGQVCTNTNGSYKCACPPGYTMYNDQCTDIDECSLYTSNCTQVCTNMPGSFLCSCLAGYRLIPQNNSCVDIDECETETDRCEQICSNYPGSANCECRYGFHLADNRKGCVKDFDPCESLAASTNQTCQYGCDATSGHAQCFCMRGYQVATDNLQCVDVNECSSNTTNECSQQCLNYPGGYQCACDVGYTLGPDYRKCAVCDPYHWGADCNNTCNCSPVGASVCDPVTGCVCSPGWLGTLCDEDRDECTTNPCSDNANCVNTPGSYRCVCQPGYTGSGNGSCVDLDECENNPCDQNCTNTEGSYLCTCRTGFYSEGDACRDVNECLLPGTCSQLCRNTIGSFACECYDGYIFNTTTRRTCDVKTECTLTNCSHGCLVHNTTEECFCSQGYQLADDRTTCLDIDECLSRPCAGGKCVNSNGSFECSCTPGYALQPDNVTCLACSKDKYGDDCAQSCTCNVTNTVSCDPVNGTCRCQSGWTDHSCNVDIDECSGGVCNSTANSTCDNTLGSYRCVCNEGFFTSSGRCYPCDATHYGKECAHECTCVRANTLYCDDVTGSCTCLKSWTGANCSEDVDECNVTGTCRTNASEVCRNYPGGFSCDCVSGYERPSPADSCTDVNECLYVGLNTCNRTSQDCNNYPGGFNCTCKAGYYQSGQTCKACSCHPDNTYSCDPNNGTCTCKQGWQGANCDVDIDECPSKPCANVSNTYCSNTNGSYSCLCQDGFFNSSGQCSPCTGLEYGPNCAYNCSCSINNTNRCDPVNGTCTCNQGWEGANCDTDVDECLRSPCTNVSHTYCSNANGSYICLCQDGFFNSSGQCLECPVGLYGKDCSSNCTCNVNNSVSCNHANGSCTCKPEWTGLTCNDDFNECAYSGCMNVSDSWCSNTVGSFKCICTYGVGNSSSQCLPQSQCISENCSQGCALNNGTEECFCLPGYQLNTDGTNCSDINECLSDPCVNGNCTDLSNSFSCSCGPGTVLQHDNVTCQVCSPFKYGLDCSSNCACNVANALKCDPVTGSCTCKDGWNGTDCEKDVDECLSNPCINGTCTNLNGSFTCSCVAGASLQPDNVTCQACPSFKYGANCSSNCTCNVTNVLRCDAATGSCTCKQGWNGTNCEQDVDECLSNPCTNGSCSNLNGSFACSCTPGSALQSDNLTCQACLPFKYGTNCSSTCLCNVANTHKCDPSTGSCTCKQGWNGTDCDRDIDECLNNPCTNGNCTNLNGSFSCSCSAGSSLQQDNATCQVCSEFKYGPNCSATCSCNVANTQSCDPVSGTCMCKQGWNGTNCDKDNDECLNNPCVYGNCTNLNGSYSCGCTPGSALQPDGVTCQNCTSSKYGPNCSFNCTCNVANNVKCDPVTGSCTCKGGWNGTNCEKDVDECLRNPCINGTCTNLNGSFACSCVAGASLQPDNVTCQACSLNKFGKDCSSTCTCDVNNTKSCDAVSGSCLCSTGWTGRNCDEDVNQLADEMYPVTVTFLFNKTFNLTDNTSTVYKDLEEDIWISLRDFFKAAIGNVFKNYTVTRLSTGSVVADGELVLDPNRLDSDQDMEGQLAGHAAKGIKNLANLYLLTVNNTNVTLKEVRYKQSIVHKNQSVCETFYMIHSCSQSEECAVIGTIPQCSQVYTGDPYKLVVGLSVGIPLFIILVIVIAILVFLCMRRRRKKARSVTSENSDDFHSIFAGGVAPKGSWGAANRMGLYTPDTLSVATTRSYGEDRLLKRVQLRRPSDLESSSWYDNVRSDRSQADRAEASTFSWEHMFQLLEPHREFEILRPAVTQTPNPTFTPQEQNPDSLA